MKPVQDEGNMLIRKIESRRVTSEEPSVVFKKTPFDYKRQTLNLKKTNELIKNPTDVKVQEEYQALINSNEHSNSIKTAMMVILLGALMLAIGIVSIVLWPAAPVAVALGITAIVTGSLCGGLGAGELIKDATIKATSTGKRMSCLFTEVMRERHEPAGGAGARAPVLNVDESAPLIPPGSSSDSLPLDGYSTQSPTSICKL